MNKLVLPDRGGHQLFTEMRDLAMSKRLPVDQVASACINVWIDAWAKACPSRKEMFEQIDHMTSRIKDIAAKRYDTAGRPIGAQPILDQIIKVPRIDA